MDKNNGRDLETGRFSKGNRQGRGRPPGSRNKPHMTKFPRGEGRLTYLRRFRDLLESIIGDLGGASAMSTGQVQMARRCALLSVHCEIMEEKAVLGESFDINAYAALTDRLGRAFERLGFDRRPKDVTLSLQQYLAAAQQDVILTEADLAPAEAAKS